MKKVLLWILGLLALAGVASLLAWAFIEGRAEIEKEREQERPVKVPPRVYRSATGEVIVKIDRETQKRIALRTEALPAAAEPRRAIAYGKVLDAAPLASLAAEVAAAEAALRASRAEAERLRALHQDEKNISLRALEAAEAQLAVDQSRLRSARERLSLAWGSKLSDLDLPSLQESVARLVKFEAVLIEVSLPAGEVLNPPPAAARVFAVGQEDRPVSTDAVSPAPSVGPLTRGQGFFLHVANPPPDLRPGASAIAHFLLPGEPLRGVMVPRSALVRFNGIAWAYVQGGEDEFTRREVQSDLRTERGWFTGSGFQEGERVVVEGAQVLLSEELKSQIQVGEDEGKE